MEIFLQKLFFFTKLNNCGLRIFLKYVKLQYQPFFVINLKEAVRQLRQSETLDELEPLLAFFATFVLESKLVQEIMRWDMAILRDSPWYQEILKEGENKGIK